MRSHVFSSAAFFCFVLVFLKLEEIIPLFLSFFRRRSHTKDKGWSFPKFNARVSWKHKDVVCCINLSLPLKIQFWFNPFSNSVGSVVRMLILKRSRM